MTPRGRDYPRRALRSTPSNPVFWGTDSESPEISTGPYGFVIAPITFFLDGRDMLRVDSASPLHLVFTRRGAGAGPCETLTASPASDPKFGRLKGAVGCRQ